MNESLTTEELAKAAYKIYCQGGTWETLYPPSQECWRRIVEMIRSSV